MPKHSSFLRIENFLEPDTLYSLLNFTIENESKFYASKVLKESKKVVDTFFRESLTNEYLGAFETIIKNKILENLSHICHATQIPLFEPDSIEVQMAAHGHGAFFKPHIDTQTENILHSRIISAVYYYHSEPKLFEGGELVLYPFDFLPGNDEPIKIEPLNNSLVVFPSFVLHEVLAVHAPNIAFKDCRFSINCWINK